MSRLSIIMPVLDEGEGIAAALDALGPLRAGEVEVIVVDGGSRDATVQRARLRADRVLTAPRGRALQMNAGAEKAAGDVLLFLHADTRLPPAAEHVILNGLEYTGRAWGRFDVTIAGRHPLLAVVSRLMNIRSRVTGIATGQCLEHLQLGIPKYVGGEPRAATKRRRERKERVRPTRRLSDVISQSWDIDCGAATTLGLTQALEHVPVILVGARGDLSQNRGRGGPSGE